MSTTYPPLAEVRNDLRVGWYRCPIEHARLRELSKRSDVQGWFQAGGHILLLAATGVLTYYFWSQQIWIGFAVALFAHGTAGSFFRGIAPHELGHGTVFRTKWLNKLFLYVYSLLSWWDPFDYASSHTYHHRYTMYPDGDRENLLPLTPTVGATFLLQMFTVNLITRPGRIFTKGGLISTIIVTAKSAFGIDGSREVPINEWLQALHADQPAEHRRSIWWSRMLLLFHGSVVAVSIVTGLWVLPLLITFFPFIASWGAYFVGLTQHCGLRDNVPDFRKSTRSITLNPLAEFLYWRMNWHIEHHMYAGVPCYNLKKLYREIAEDMPAPRTLRGAWREMRETWRRQQTDPDYQFDTPLPAAAQGIRAGAPDELESSIGELAPEGLR
ncbi:MAG TPA: fatty acid desaturase [candidate division Zixibacteria bacterium]|nr:fatty acid desaturase [candidate division Zixibacteria bacterium]